MTIYLKSFEEQNQEKAKQIMTQLEHTKLADITSQIQIYFDPDDLNTLVHRDQSMILQYHAFQTMVKECLNSDSGFVITLQNPNIDSFKDKGTYVKVIDFNNLPNGLLGITVKAINRVEIKSIETDADNLNFGDVMPISDPIVDDQSLLSLIHI